MLVLEEVLEEVFGAEGCISRLVGETRVEEPITLIYMALIIVGFLNKVI